MSIEYKLTDRSIKYLTFFIIALFSLLPLFISFPYRVNLYVTWEGAYRMWLGQMPYRDFGMPLGYGFWIIPYLSFLVFGPYMISLVKAQAFLNIISLVVLRSTFKLFKLKEATILLAILALSLSFVLINFWPWYNHTVFVFELIALFFVLKYIIGEGKLVYLALSPIFIWLAVLTKQDGGGLSLMFAGVLVIVHFVYTKDWKAMAVFISSLIVFALLLIGPFLQWNFSYWFNYGQEPHFSRISGYDFMRDIFYGSAWIKGYLFLVLLLTIRKHSSIKSFLSNKVECIFTLFVVGMLLQAMIIQVTSFSPPTVNLYFHTFAIAFVVFHFQESINLNKLIILITLVAALAFWNSDNAWKYSQKVFAKVVPSLFTPPPAKVVSKGNWAPQDTIKTKPVIWKHSSLKSLKKIKLPENTIEGINKIKQLPIIDNSDLRVLNMTNLTPLAHELNYIPQSGENIPLWYHQGVALFDKEVNLLCNKIASEEYDLILFEDMPEVDNFFPYEVRDCASSNYTMVNKFLSPTGYTTDSIEVYIKTNVQR